MGKSAKIRKLNYLCKKLGLGRFYKGKGRLVKRDFSYNQLNNLFILLSTQPGTVVHDCDGFNHVVKGLARNDRLYADNRAGKYTKTWYRYEDQLEFEDGSWSCGCPGGIEPARSREEIEAWMKGYYLSDGFTTWFGGDISEKVLRMKADLLAGEHICDERGVLLDKYKDLKAR